MPTAKLLRQALSELEKLPLDDQNAIATRLLDEIKDEQIWSARFAATTNKQWDNLAATARAEIATGDTQALDDFLEINKK